MKIKISYEGMPFEHVNNNLRILNNMCFNCDIKTQPNTFYIDGDVNVEELLKKCTFFFNPKVESYDHIDGLTYEECKKKILTLIEPYNVLNKSAVLHKNACLYINPKICVFDLNTMKLSTDIVISVLNDQLIFFTNNKQCIFVCEEDCNPSMDAIKLILNGRLYDRFIAMERDLKSFDAVDYINDTIMNLCKKMEANEFLCRNIYYDRHSRTVNEDLSLLGIVSFLKFGDERLRQIHKEGEFSHDVMVAKCVMHLSNLLIYDLPFGNLDPFGVKKSADFVVNYAINHKLQIPFLSSEIEEFLKKRLINKLKGSDLTLCKNIEWNAVFKDKEIVLDLASIRRIVKLVQKSNPTEHVELSEQEILLRSLVHELKYSDINLVVSKFIDYINDTKVGLYFERIEILKELVNKIHSIIDIK